MWFGNQSVNRNRSARSLFKYSLFLLAAAVGVSAYLQFTHPLRTEATSLVRLASPSAKPAINPTQKAGGPVQSRANTPQCQPAAKLAEPATPTVNADDPGLHQSKLPTVHYSVYGNTVDQINSQLNSCSPVVEGGERYAASTDYSISWTFRYQPNESGVCAINSVSVGLNLREVYPSWQSSDAGLVAKWQKYTSNLTAHEAGHVQLAQSYAATILLDLQGFPATDCTNIAASANAKANADLAALNQANANYDDATNHGATQGAILN